MPSSGPTVIEVFADVLCPFAHVGLQRFTERRAELGRTDVALWVRAWPLEVVNDSPHDAGLIGEEIDVIRTHAARSSFAGFREESVPPSSLPALELAHAAYRRSTETGEAVSLELRDLVFEQGVDIGDPAVLGRVAGDHGLDVSQADREGVMADHADGGRRGVVGSPYFFTPDGEFFCPALDVGHDDDDNLHVAPDADTFERFSAACFGPR